MPSALRLSARIVARTLVALAAVWMVTQVLARLPVAEIAHGPALTGTFIQLREEHSTWKKENWRELFDEFRQLHLSRAIVQWSVLDRFAFFPLDSQAAAGNSPIEAVLRFGDKTGMEITIGLDHDTHFGDRIEGAPREVDRFLQERFNASYSVAKALLPLVSAHKSFKGWYISEEIDDLNWRNMDRRRMLTARLGELTNSLHGLSPAAHITISGFTSGAQSASDLRALWSDLLDSAPHIDSVLFQDGIGVGYLNLQRLPEYLQALRSVTHSRGRTLVVITEVFQQSAGYPLNDKPFQAIPAPLTRIDEQLQIAAQYSAASVAFSVPEYLSSRAGDQAAALFSSYLGRFAVADRVDDRSAMWFAGYLM